MWLLHRIRLPWNKGGMISNPSESLFFILVCCLMFLTITEEITLLICDRKQLWLRIWRLIQIKINNNNDSWNCVRKKWINEIYIWGTWDISEYIRSRNHVCPGYDTKLYPALRLQFWNPRWCGITILLPLHSSPLWAGVIIHIRLPSTDKIHLFEIMFKIILN